MVSFFWVKNWNETHVFMGYFLFFNSLEDLLTYAICFGVEWCNNEGVCNAQNNVEVYWKLWSRKPISFTTTPSFKAFKVNFGESWKAWDYSSSIHTLILSPSFLSSFVSMFWKFLALILFNCPLFTNFSYYSHVFDVYSTLIHTFGSCVEWLTQGMVTEHGLYIDYSLKRILGQNTTTRTTKGVGCQILSWKTRDFFIFVIWNYDNHGRFFFSTYEYQETQI
jgi:hypothetical protein